MQRGTFTLIFSVLMLVPVVHAQKSEAESTQDRIASLIEKARTARAVIRPQAALRLVRMGDEAGQALLSAAGESSEDFAALGKDLIEVSGAFPLPELRSKLWMALSDDAFPWRSSAALGLVNLPSPKETPHFVDLLDDPLASVRAAAVRALGALDARQHKDLLKSKLHWEGDDRVRRTIALQLDQWGERWALWFLVADLRRSDTFFGQPTGSAARIAAYRQLLERIENPGFEFQPSSPPDSTANTQALEQIEAALTPIAGQPIALPAVARVQAPILDERLGLELRSCRLGEFFLRWTDDDTLLVGRGIPARVQLPAGTTQTLARIATERSAKLGDKRFWGNPGCDQETFHLRDANGKDHVVLISKGPLPVLGLRPSPLGGVATDLLASLPDAEHEDPRLNRLRSRVDACLEAIGGPRTSK